MSIIKVSRPTIRILLIFILLTQNSCSFIISAGGSLVGNLAAQLLHDEIVEKDKDKDKDGDREGGE